MSDHMSLNMPDSSTVIIAVLLAVGAFSLIISLTVFAVKQKND